MEANIKELGTDDPDTLISMGNLALLYAETGKLGRQRNSKPR